ncbi:hypothetical protein, partial [Vibrio coralliilyticus]
TSDIVVSTFSKNLNATEVLTKQFAALLPYYGEDKMFDQQQALAALEEVRQLIKPSLTFTLLTLMEHHLAHYLEVGLKILT